MIAAELEQPAPPPQMPMVPPYAGWDSGYYGDADAPVVRRYGGFRYIAGLLLLYAVAVVVMPVVVLVLVAWWGWDKWRMRWL